MDLLASFLISQGQNALGSTYITSPKRLLMKAEVKGKSIHLH